MCPSWEPWNLESLCFLTCLTQCREQSWPKWPGGLVANIEELEYSLETSSPPSYWAGLIDARGSGAAWWKHWCECAGQVGIGCLGRRIYGANGLSGKGMLLSCPLVRWWQPQKLGDLAWWQAHWIGTPDQWGWELGLGTGGDSLCKAGPSLWISTVVGIVLVSGYFKGLDPPTLKRPSITIQLHHLDAHPASAPPWLLTLELG